MPLYEVTVRQSYFDQLCINVFSYFVQGGVGVTPTSLELLTLMGLIPTGSPLAFPADSVAETIWGIQDDDVLWLSAEARELYSVTDFYEAAYSPPIEGAQTDNQGLPPFNAWGFYSARVRTDIRRGFKRFVGVPEAYVDNGGAVASTIVADLVDVTDAMSELLSGVSAVYQPCVISREKVVDPDTGAVSYQLYATESEQEEHCAYPLVWTHYNTVRSQTSRQYGRGS
jgi:hypothetical protein